ncbi:hypothetical protein Tco_0434709 [Tanacetum coccineum]
MYKEYLAEFWYSAKALENSKVSFFVPTGGIYGEVGVNAFKNAIGAHYIPHSSEYVAPPSIDIVRPWFETIGYGETILAKGTLKKSLLPPSLANGINIDYASIFWEDIIIKLNKRHKEKGVPYTRFLSLLMMHKMKEGYGDSKVTPYPTQVFSVNNWALKLNQPKEPPFTDHMLAICTVAKQCSEATNGGSSKAPTGSKTGYLKRKKESSSAMDSNPIQTSASTLVVAEMHKDDQEETGGPTSLELEDLAKLVSSVQPSFKDLNSPEDDPIIIVDDSREDEEANEVHATINAETVDALVPKSSSPKSSLIQELTNQVLILQSQKHKLELEKNNAEAEAEAALLRDQPSFPNIG